MAVAKSKGFGSEPEDILVPEKVALIHSEISEAYDAYVKNNLAGSHGFYEELADVFLRTLHLAGIFKIDFSRVVKAESKISSEIEKQVLCLHGAVSEAYENYRHKNIGRFKELLIEVVMMVIEISELYKFDIEAEAHKKMELNRTRSWNSGLLNEKISV